MPPGSRTSEQAKFNDEGPAAVVILDGAEDLSVDELLADIEAGGRVRTYRLAVSFVVVTIYSPQGPVYVPAGKMDLKRILYTLLSLLLGWWGIPWGPVRTIQALAHNLGSSSDMTEQFKRSYVGALSGMPPVTARTTSGLPPVPARASTGLPPVPSQINYIPASSPWPYSFEERSLLRVTDLAFATDSGSVFWTSEDGTVTQVDPKSGAMLWRYDALRSDQLNSKVEQQALAVSSDRVVAVSADGLVRAWKLPELGENDWFEGRFRSTTSLAFSPAGDRLAQAGSGEYGARILSAATWSPVAQIPGHEPWVGEIAFAPSGDVVATLGGLDLAVRLWASDSGVQLGILHGSRMGLSALAWSPVVPGLLVTGGTEPILRMWDTETQEEVGVVDAFGQKYVTELAFSPDGRLLVAGSDSGEIAVWETSTWQLVARLFHHRDAVSALAWAPDGSVFASAGGQHHGRGDNIVRLWTGDMEALAALG